MSTTIRPEISKKNEYWMDKHRYYELKHFCLQYNTWKKIYNILDESIIKTNNIEFIPKSNKYSDPTAAIAEIKVYYLNRIEMLEKAAIKTDEVLSKYILKGVTEGLSYDILKARLNIPCCKDVYYKLYRYFFKILSDLRR